MRCLTLADTLRDAGCETTFVCRDLFGNLADSVAARGHRLALLPAGEASELEDAAETVRALGGRVPPWVVVDHYGLGAVWERAARVAGASRIVAIDDMADRAHDCDLLIDQNLRPDLGNAYRTLVPAGCAVLSGPRHALLRPEFAEARRTARPRTAVRRVLILFGGSDPFDLTSRALSELAEVLGPEVALDVVAGPSNPHTQSLREACARLPQALFHATVDSPAQLMAEADLGIGSPGSATWERCALGLPAVLVAFAGNQIAVGEAVAASGAAECLGRAEVLPAGAIGEAAARLAADAQALSTMSERALALGAGAPGMHAVAAAVLASGVVSRDDVSLEPWTDEDLAALLDWRNSPEVREMSFDDSEVTEADHRAFFADRRRDGDRIQFVFRVLGVPAGTAYFTGDLESAPEWGFSLASGWGGLGLGRLMCALALEYAFEQFGTGAVNGRALASNASSIDLHMALGFVRGPDGLVERRGTREAVATFRLDAGAWAGRALADRLLAERVR